MPSGQNCQAEEGSGGWDEEDFGPEAVDFRHERPCLHYRPAIPLPQDRNRLVTNPLSMMPPTPRMFSAAVETAGGAAGRTAGIEMI